jgi:hypothetical protein
VVSPSAVTPLKTPTTWDNLGVCSSVGNELEVTDLGGGSIQIDTGAAVIDGLGFFNDAALSLSPPAPTANPRIDRIVVRKNYTNAQYDPAGDAGDEEVPAYTARITRIAGAEVADPDDGDIPAMTHSTDRSTYWDVPLAHYEISIGGAISNLVDDREFIWSTFLRSDAVTNTVSNAITLQHETSGLAAAGFGTGVGFEAENDNGDMEPMGRLAFVWASPTDGSERSYLQIATYYGAGRYVAGIISGTDNTSVVAGNARGVAAVDLQVDREAANEVAGGEYSGLFAGSRNRVSGEASVIVGGTGNIVTEEWSAIIGSASSQIVGGNHDNSVICGGAANFIDGGGEGDNFIGGGVSHHLTGNASAIVGGYDNEITGNYSAALGGHTIEMSGYYSGSLGGLENDINANYGATIGGAHNWIQDQYSVILGSAYVTAYSWNCVYHGYGGFTATEDSNGLNEARGAIQMLAMQVVTHNNANWHTLYLNGVSASEAMYMSNNGAWMMHVLVVGITQGCGKTLGFEIIGLVENDAGTASVIQQTVRSLDTEDSSFDVRLAVQVVNPFVEVQVMDSDAAGDIVRWVASIRTAEVKFPL